MVRFLEKPMRLELVMTTFDEALEFRELPRLGPKPLLFC
jgi:hypothetical protein